MSNDLRFSEAEARTILWVRALEEADPRGQVLPLSERASIADEGATDAARLAARARRLWHWLQSRAPHLASATTRRWRFGLVIIPAMFGFGALLGGLPAERTINLLLYLLAGPVLWNLAVYLILIGLALFGGDGGLRTWLVGRSLDLAHWLMSRGEARRHEDLAVMAKATALFVVHWGQAAAGLMKARVTLVLHLGAASLVLGQLASVYAQGLVLDYSVSWESTFLTSGQAEQLLHFFFAPALALGASLPLPTAALQAPASSPAAAWRHRLAVSAGAWVIVPRVALAAVSAGRARALARAVRLEGGAPYFRRVLMKGGEAGVIRVVPYCHQPKAAATDRLHTLMLDVFGPRALVELAPPLAYGDPLSAEGAGIVVVWFTLNQCPEPDIHAAVMARLRVLGTRSAALVDVATWAGDAKKTSERRRAWDAVFREAGVPIVHADLEQSPSPALIDALGAAAQ